MGCLIALAFVVFLTLTIVSLVLISTGWRAKENVDRTHFVVRPSLPLRICAVIFGFFWPVVLMAILLLFPPARQADVLAGEITLTGFKALGYALIRQTLNSRLLVAPAGLVCYFALPWKEPAIIPWEDVVEVRHECVGKWFVFVSADRQKITVPLYSVGPGTTDKRHSRASSSRRLCQGCARI